MTGEKWFFNKKVTESQQEKVKKELSDDKISDYVPKSTYQDVNEEIIKNKKFSNDDSLPEDIYKQKMSPDGIVSEERREGLDEKYAETIDSLKKSISEIAEKHNQLWENIMSNPDLKNIVERYLSSHQKVEDGKNSKTTYAKYLASIHKDLLEKTKKEMTETKVPWSGKSLLDTFEEIANLIQQQNRLEKFLKERNGENGDDLGKEIKEN